MNFYKIIVDIIHTLFHTEKQQWGILGGQEFKSRANVMNCREKQYIFLTLVKISKKSSGNFINCQENQYIFYTTTLEEF